MRLIYLKDSTFPSVKITVDTLIDVDLKPFQSRRMRCNI